jgi:hypothetical protein
VVSKGGTQEIANKNSSATDNDPGHYVHSSLSVWSFWKKMVLTAQASQLSFWKKMVLTAQASQLTRRH